MKKMIVVLALLSFPANAQQPQKDAAVTFTDKDVQQLTGLMDVACKAGGMQVCQVALELTFKVQQAQKKANEPAEPVKPPAQK